MARIIRTNFDDKKTIFNAIMGSSQCFKNLAGTVIDVVGYVVYEKGEEKEGEEHEIITTFLLKEGGFVGGNSKTISCALDSYLATFGDWPAGEIVSFKITKEHGKKGDYCGIELV